MGSGSRFAVSINSINKILVQKFTSQEVWKILLLRYYFSLGIFTKHFEMNQFTKDSSSKVSENLLPTL